MTKQHSLKVGILEVIFLLVDDQSRWYNILVQTLEKFWLCGPHLPFPPLGTLDLILLRAKEKKFLR